MTHRDISEIEEVHKKLGEDVRDILEILEDHARTLTDLRKDLAHYRELENGRYASVPVKEKTAPILIGKKSISRDVMRRAWTALKEHPDGITALKLSAEIDVDTNYLRYALRWFEENQMAYTDGKDGKRDIWKPEMQKELDI